MCIIAKKGLVMNADIENKENVLVYNENKNKIGQVSKSEYSNILKMVYRDPVNYLRQFLNVLAVFLKLAIELIGITPTLIVSYVMAIIYFDPSVSIQAAVDAAIKNSDSLVFFLGFYLSVKLIYWLNFGISGSKNIFNEEIIRHLELKIPHVSLYKKIIISTASSDEDK